MQLDFKEQPEAAVSTHTTQAGQAAVTEVWNWELSLLEDVSFHLVAMCIAAHTHYNSFLTTTTTNTGKHCGTTSLVTDVTVKHCGMTLLVSSVTVRH